MLSCGCVDAVAGCSCSGDEATCARHGRVTVTQLAVSRLRAAQGYLEAFGAVALDLLQHAQRAECDVDELQRELYVRLLPDLTDIGAAGVLARAGYECAAAWEGSVARWMYEAGAHPQEVADVLTFAGTTEWETYQALTEVFEWSALDDHERAADEDLVEGASH